jgi:hypothetical protein
VGSQGGHCAVRKVHHPERQARVAQERGRRNIAQRNRRHEEVMPHRPESKVRASPHNAPPPLWDWDHAWFAQARVGA